MVSRRTLLSAGGLLAGNALARAAVAPDPPACPATVPAARADGVHTGGSRSVRVDGKYGVWVRQVGTGTVPVLTL
ncbi:MAG TPA: hypothetical protein VFO23_04940, partial [Steroidobacteraceae bacterium]|nr:hypothetical protein [Steroidobacteraceae bacterium]